MTRRLISSGSQFERDIGYSRAVVDGEWIFVSGTTGYDYATMKLADGVAAQAEQAMRNIDTALKQAGGPSELHIYPTGGHGYGLRRSEHLVTAWPDRAADWMRSRGLLARR